MFTDCKEIPLNFSQNVLLRPKIKCCVTFPRGDFPLLDNREALLVKCRYLRCCLLLLQCVLSLQREASK